MRFAGAAAAAVAAVWNGFWRLVFFPFRLIGRLLRRPAGAMARLFQKIREKAAQLLKKGLKRAASLLYNHKKDVGKPPLAAVERESDADEGR